MKQIVNGVLLLDKPSGISSNKALQRARYLYQAKKAGHTGTLDPLASGLLPICFGEATKFASFALTGIKEYIATFKLGFVSDTYDAEGIIKPISGASIVLLQNFIDICNSFIGVINQVPPIYSALKVAGRPLYSYARNNELITIKARQVSIYNIDILSFDEEDQSVTLKVNCSAGTYIRSLAHDIGQALGSGAYLSLLRRCGCANFQLDNAVSLDKLAELDLVARHKLLLSPEILVNHLLSYNLNGNEYDYLRHGHSAKLATQALNTNSYDARLYYKNIFIGVAKLDSEVIIPKRLISTNYLLAL